MSSTKGIKPPQDGSSLKSVEIDLLQSRFAALSHVAAASPKRHSAHLPVTATTPARRLGKGSEACLDHHTPPYGDEDVVRKRQRGSQEMAEFALGDKSLPSVQESSTPFAPSFGNTPVETIFSPIPITLDTEASVLVPFTRTIRGSRREGKTGVKKKHSAAMIFLGYSDEASADQESERDEDLNANSLIAEQTPVLDTIRSELNEKNKDMGMVYGVCKPEEAQARIGPITTELFVKGLGISATVSEELPRITVGKTPVFKAEDQHFKELPEVVLTRYPRMAKYLNTLPTPENQTKQVISTPEPLREKITWSRSPPREIVEDGVRITESEGSVDVIPGNEITKSEDGAETPNFKLTPRKSRRKVVRIQGNTVESKILPIINVPDMEPVEPVSQRPRLPERYAIPITTRVSELAAQKPTGIPGHGVSETTKTEEELLMEQLALIDERFSRESAAHPDDEMPAFSLSHTGSSSAETSIRFPISPAVCGAGITARNMSTQANTSPQTPKRSHEAGPEDPERFRRSMGPSPSPHTSRVGDMSATNFAESFPGGLTNNVGAGKGGQQTTEWAIAAENWLNKFAGSTKPTPAIQPRSKPSVLARMHSVSSTTSANGEMNTADTDGVAPGEWIKPVGLNKKPPVKPKIGITAELAPLLFQPTPAPIVRSMVETVAVNVTGSAHQWTKVVANQSNNQYSKSISPEPGTSIDRTASDVVHLGSNITKTSSVGPTVEAEESARAKEKEKVVMEWRNRGFTEVGRMGETGSPALNKKQVEEQMQKLSSAVVFRSDGSESGVGGSVRFEEKRWITPREGGLFASPPRVQPVNRKAQEDHMTLSRDLSPTGARNRRAFGRGSSPAPIQPPVRLQEQQLVDPNVQELANILKTLQTTQPKAGAKSVQANDSFAKSWQNFIPTQAPKVSQAPIISQTPVARQIPMVSQMPVIRQTPIFSQTPVARQTSLAPQVLAREASRVPAASMVPPAPSAGPRRLVDVAPPAPSAYSGTFVDRRFATPEVFRKEAMSRAEKEKERNEALEALIKQSRDEADRKCYDSGSATRMKNRNIRVAAGITVGKNAKGEMDWIISNPPPQLKPVPGPDRLNDGSGSIKARRHHR